MTTSPNAPSDPRPAHTRLLSVLAEEKIDINHPALSDLSEWLKNAENNEISSITRLLSNFSAMDIKPTAELLSQTWQNADKICDLVHTIYEAAHGPMVSLQMERKNGEITVTREVNPAKLPANTIDLIIQFMAANNTNSSLTQHDKRLLDTLIYHHGLSREQNHHDEEIDETAIDPRDQALQNTHQTLVNNAGNLLVDETRDLGNTFVAWRMHTQTIPRRQLNDFTQPVTTLTPETGAIVPYQPANKI